MNREADHSIKGFVYQFNKTLIQLLEEPDGTEIQVEGIVEDIDVISPSLTKAIQCKYHEKKGTYNLSDIFKPILQMLVHYSQHKTDNIKYILYAHFSGEAERIVTLTKTDISTIINTTNQDYLAKYVSIIKPPTDKTIQGLVAKQKKSKDDKKKIKDYYAITTGLSLSIDINEFLKPEKFCFEIGKSFEDLTIQAKGLFEKESDFSKEDIEDLFYPNAIQKIADLSIEHDANKRKIEKNSFVETLEKLKKTAITRWTRELTSFRKLLSKRREQLTVNLKKNSRLRYFLFDETSIDNFEDEIVNFISDFIDVYNSKIKLHDETPLFCIDATTSDLLQNIEKRLYQKKIDIETGFRGGEFFQDAFLKEPERKINDNWVEFKAKIAKYSDTITDIINAKKCDDLFVISSKSYSKIDTQDLNYERLDVNNFSHIKYLLKLTKNID